MAAWGSPCPVLAWHDGFGQVWLSEPRKPSSGAHGSRMLWLAGGGGAATAWSPLSGISDARFRVPEVVAERSGGLWLLPWGDLVADVAAGRLPPLPVGVRAG